MVGSFKIYTLTALENFEQTKEELKGFFQNAA